VKTSIYLPDDLAEQIRAHGISISEVSQAALRRAVDAATAKQRIAVDLTAVAERLRTTIDSSDQQLRAEGYDVGILWARDHATAGELAQLATLATRTIQLEHPHTVVRVMSQRDDFSYTTIVVDTGDPYWAGFVEGASQVWDAVQPLLR
jgi:hypothetical protein